MAPEVKKAIADLERAFGGHRIEILETGDGGAHVVVHDLELGSAFTPTTSWVGFTITYNYPLADVYPHFVCPDVTLADGRALPTPPLNADHQMPGFNHPAVMVSRRSNRWNPQRDTAALKLMRILTWFAEQDRDAGHEEAL